MPSFETMRVTPGGGEKFREVKLTPAEIKAREKAKPIQRAFTKGEIAEKAINDVENALAEANVEELVKKREDMATVKEEDIVTDKEIEAVLDKAFKKKKAA